MQAKGVTVLSIPIAALFVALFSIHWFEADTPVANVTRAELQRLRIPAAGGPAAQRDAVGQAIARVQFLADAQESRRRRLYEIVILCGIAGPLGGLFVNLLLSGRMVKRLGRIEENARRLAQGLPLETLPGGPDEIGVLARQIEDAAIRMRDHERDLSASEGRYRDLFDGAPVAYDETDRDGVIRRFNKEVCALRKCGPDRVLGSRAWDFVAPEQRGDFRDAMLDRIAAGAECPPFECEYLLDARRGWSSRSAKVWSAATRAKSSASAGPCST